jgi:CRISPR-associated protein Cas5t
VIALHLTVPIACWRRGPAREFLETESFPPPATCYGALLSLVGETDVERHRGCRVTAGLLREPTHSVVLRTLWRIKDRRLAAGTGENARPDFQALATGAELMIWCDSADEPDAAAGLEARVAAAMIRPETVDRFGGWSLGESTHLVNDATLVPDARPPGPCRAFLMHPDGELTLPVWVDHVGSAGTRYVVGRLEATHAAPPSDRVPQIPLAQSGAGAVADAQPQGLRGRDVHPAG